MRQYERGNRPAAAERRSQRHIVVIGIAMIFFAAGAFGASSSQDKKLTVEELVTRHIASIGSAEALSGAKSRAVGGTITLTLRIGGAGNLPGEGAMISTGNRYRYGMKFRSNEYPNEDMAFDGSRVATDFLPKGTRSQLSAFLSQQNAPLKEGLMGGVLSTAWPLLRLDRQQARLEYRGTKKIDGRELYEVNYRPRKGASDLKIALYFEPETFRHVRTQYNFQIGARIGTRDAPEQNPESYYSLTEDFDDFHAVDGLTLPHKYRLQLSIQSTAGSALYDYTLAVNRISHNETFDEKLFTLK